jgi:hypothetical protein
MDPYSAIVNDKSQPSYEDDVQNVFDGIMFLTACDDDFILKCEWIHISSGIMWECLPVENESTPWHTTYTTCAAHYHVYTENKLFEFLKYNNICSLIAIVNESISKLCGLSTKYAQIWGTVKTMPCHIYSSTENEARAVWMNDAPQTKIR